MKSILLSGAAVGVLLAVGAGPSVAVAKTAKKPSASAELQKQIDELRDQVQFLKDRLDEQASVNRQSNDQLKAAQAEADAAKAQAVASAQEAKAAEAQVIQTIPVAVQTAVAANKPKTDKLYYKGVSVTLGGFAEAASIYRDHDETADISSSFSKIPYANDAASHTGETRFTARQSRYSALVQGDIDPTTHAYFYGEFDFQGAAQTANANQSSSYNPRIRNLYGQVDWDSWGLHLLAGQNWSLVTLNNKGITPRSEVTPPQIDAQYIPGFAWARQPGFRIVKDFGKELWIGVSVENAQTTLGGSAPSAGVTPGTAVVPGVTITDVQAPANGFYSGTNYSLNTVPDVIGKVAYEKKFGAQTVHVEGFGIMRTFTDRVAYSAAAASALGVAAGSNTLTTTGGGGGGSIAVYDVIPKHLDLQASVMAGNGIGRYGSAGLPDTTIKANGGLVGIPETMFLAGGTFHANPQWDIYAFGGGEFEQSKTFATPASLKGPALIGYGLTLASDAGCVTEGGSCSAITKSIDQITAGFWDKFYQGPFGRAQFGIQYSYTEKKAFADATGFSPKATENMIFTSFRFYPF